MEKIKKNSIYFYILNNLYFEKNQYLDEFQRDDKRGHGIMVINLKNLLVAVPLRSKIPEYNRNSPHIFKYKEYEKDEKIYIKALDFSKMTLISEEDVDFEKPFIFKDAEEKKFYKNNSNRIFLKLNNYIEKYKKICTNIENKKIVTDRTIKPYKYSTLRNYHSQLDITLMKEEILNIIRENK